MTPEVKRMYDGYIFGDKEIYNPWSIINYAEEGNLFPYWVNTSSDELLKNIFEKNKKETRQMLEELILGNSIECKYNNKITFLDLDSIEKSEIKDIVLNFLLTSGYLTKVKETELTASGNLLLKIPNMEVQKIYVDILSKWTKDATNTDTQMLIEFKKILLSNDIEELEKMLNSILNCMSYTETQESYYHGYMLA